MKRVISASRRTDLVAFFPEWLSSVLKQERARVYGPGGHAYAVDLKPEAIHTLVLWSKNFSNLIEDKCELRKYLQKYDQLYLHFTITGLGASFIERGVVPPSTAISQLDNLIKFVKHPERISVRFDPIVYWKDESGIKTNLHFFEELAPELSQRGVKDVRFSFAQWYGKAVKRSAKYGFSYLDPSAEEKKEAALFLSQIARNWNLSLFSCTQNFLAQIPGIRASACIDGSTLHRLHPKAEPASTKKDKSQRPECGCTESIDIGSYTQSCPHSCLYCYANPKL